MLTVLEIIKRSTDYLAGRGIESARLNAEHLIGHALGLRRMQLYLQFDRPLDEAELERIRPLVRRRGQREPLQYLLGEGEFAGVSLKLDRRALIPRPETELLCSLVVAKVGPPPATVLDLGTGTGALALALAHQYPEARVTAVDVSPEAVALATENAARNALADRVQVLQSDWFSALAAGRQFDLVVANPPYLSADETAESAPEIREHEPAVALSPGPTGYEAIERIVGEAAGFMRPGALLAMETGITQHEALRVQLARSGFAAIEFADDLAGRPRFAFARAV